MRTRNFVILDRETDYGARLARRLAQREEFGFRVQYCHEMAQAEAFAGREQVDFLLTTDAFQAEERRRLSCELCFVMGEEENLNEGEIPMNRYQSVEETSCCILQACLDAGVLLQERMKCGKSRLIGLYSPVHRTGKTSFALELGSLFAKEDSVLYVNLEEYAGVGEELSTQRGQTLEDFLYYLKQEEKNLGYRLETIVQRLGEMDYLPPIPVGQDLREVSGEDWSMFLDCLLEKSRYGWIFVEFGDCIQGLYKHLERCDLLYMPLVEDETAKAKERQYEKTLEILNMQELRKHTRKLYLGKSSVKQLAKQEWEGLR